MFMKIINFENQFYNPNYYYFNLFKDFNPSDYQHNYFLKQRYLYIIILNILNFD
jgi:hypothetical protein